MSAPASPHAATANRLAPIVETLLPDFPALDAAGRDRVEGDVTRYVASQVAAMPAFLHLPFRGALLAFDLLALPLHRRRFAQLAPEQRGAYLARWSDAPLAAMRDFVRLLRSTTLLVYFDHPIVRGRLDDERRQARASGREADGE